MTRSVHASKPREGPRAGEAPSHVQGSSGAARKGQRTDEGQIHQQRLRTLSGVVAELGLGALLVSNPKDVGYLTGFLGGDSYVLVFAGTGATGSGARRAMIISDFRYAQELEPVQGVVDVTIRSGSMLEAVAGAVGGADAPASVGLQAEHITVAERAAMARKLGSKLLRDTANLVPRLRLIKDDAEVGLIRKAIRIQEQALLAVLPGVKPGVSELELAARLESEMKMRGSSEPGFKTIVAGGPAGSLPHYRPGPGKLGAGKPVLIDWGAVYGGYHGDMTRVFGLGKWPAKIAEIYPIVLEAHQAAAAALAPGKGSGQVDAIARLIIAKGGFGEQFGHGLGHGVGLSGHEEPRLTNMLGSTKLEAGMVVTIEPGIYLPGVGGVRIEDVYLISETGAVNLCTLKKTLEWATL